MKASALCGVNESAKGVSCPLRVHLPSCRMVSFCTVSIQLGSVSAACALISATASVNLRLLLLVFLFCFCDSVLIKLLRASRLCRRQLSTVGMYSVACSFQPVRPLRRVAMCCFTHYMYHPAPKAEELASQKRKFSNLIDWIGRTFCSLH